MGKFLGYLILVCLFSTAVLAQVTIDRPAERTKFLAQLANPPIQEFSVTNRPSVDAKTSTFLDFFQSEIWPTMNKTALLNFKSGMIHVAVDRALYNDETEMKQWKAQEDEADIQLQVISSQKDWQDKIKKWAQLSEGLHGEMAEYARALWRQTELSSFTEKELPLLKRQTEIMSQISVIANKSPLVEGLAANEKATNDVYEDFFTGKMSFNDAWKKVESLIATSRTAHGQDIATRGRDLFNEVAVIKTKLAQSKGYKTWAEYRIAVQAVNHKAPFNTVDGLVKFLQKILDDTLPAYNEFLDKQFAAIPGANPKARRGSQRDLLAAETDTIIRQYFPKENIEKVWAETMIQSGFDPSKLETIVLDGYPRALKYTHAYMFTVSDHTPKVMTIDGRTLNPVTSADVPTSWYNSLIYIVQNYRDDGANAWTTAWHEGGHAMDYSHRQDLFGNGAAYGYTETHSMTMEHFFEDLEFIMAVGKNREGQPIPKDLAEKYILNSKVNALKNLRVQVSQALLDIGLWNRAYKDGDDFVKTASNLRRKLIKEATQLPQYKVSGIDPGFGAFATGHFYSGEVRYFGYILSTVGAKMSAEKLWDLLEKKTGRRTLYKQPDLAKLLIEGYYTSGFLNPFPGSIENFTGKSYSPSNLVEKAIQNVKAYQPSCGHAVNDLR